MFEKDTNIVTITLDILAGMLEFDGVSCDYIAIIY